MNYFYSKDGEIKTLLFKFLAGKLFCLLPPERNVLFMKTLGNTRAIVLILIAD